MLSTIQLREESYKTQLDARNSHFSAAKQSHRHRLQLVIWKLRKKIRDSRELKIKSWQEMSEVVDHNPINQEIQIIQKSDKAWNSIKVKKTHLASRPLCLIQQNDWRKTWKSSNRIVRTKDDETARTGPPNQPKKTHTHKKDNLKNLFVQKTNWIEEFDTRALRVERRRWLMPIFPAICNETMQEKKEFLLLQLWVTGNNLPWIYNWKLLTQWTNLSSCLLPY